MSTYDPTGLTTTEDCPATHPTTGNGCVEAPGHDGLHRAMGVLRMQLFGPELTEAAPRPAPTEARQSAGGGER